MFDISLYKIITNFCSIRLYCAINQLYIAPGKACIIREGFKNYSAHAHGGLRFRGPRTSDCMPSRSLIESIFFNVFDISFCLNCFIDFRISCTFDHIVKMKDLLIAGQWTRFKRWLSPMDTFLFLET
jgi:hypothetical protein